MILGKGIDISENRIVEISPELLDLLLKDHTTQGNILWATSGYPHEANSQILPEQITGENGSIIRPRVDKAKAEQVNRTRQMAEVFTPSWVCNAQNNLIDEAWFGRKNVFNTEFIDENGKHSWRATDEKIVFPEGKTWEDYVRDVRMEITCGEAPYLVSWYDTTTGETLPLNQRIGLLDRKLRVINENVDNSGKWLEWVQEAYKSIYGYEFQGDSLLLARENLLVTFYEYYKAKFDAEPLLKSIEYIAYIIGWNIWQMDGLKGVVPYSCHEEESQNERVQYKNLLGESQPIKYNKKICAGCKEDNIYKHNGTYCHIREWKKPSDKQKIRFIETMKLR